MYLYISICMYVCIYIYISHLRSARFSVVVDRARRVRPNGKAAVEPFEWNLACKKKGQLGWSSLI